MKDAQIDIARADQADIVVDAQVLGVQKLVPVEVDLHPRRQKARVIGALREVHEDLIDRLRQDEMDLHPPQHRRLQGVKQRLVGNEIGVVITTRLRAP